MEGSWGLTADMQSATYYARLAVERMGMGAKTGRMSLIEDKTGLSEKTRADMDDDTNVILKNAEKVSNLIIQAYAPFVQKFTDKYAQRVGTGECIIMAEEFRAFLDEWLASASAEERKRISDLEVDVLDIIDKTKRGELA